jgi:hypothetical protein
VHRLGTLTLTYHSRWETPLSPIFLITISLGERCPGKVNVTTQSNIAGRHSVCLPLSQPSEDYITKVFPCSKISTLSHNFTADSQLLSVVPDDFAKARSSLHKINTHTSPTHHHVAYIQFRVQHTIKAYYPPQRDAEHDPRARASQRGITLKRHCARHPGLTNETHSPSPFTPQTYNHHPTTLLPTSATYHTTTFFDLALTISHLMPAQRHAIQILRIRLATALCSLWEIHRPNHPFQTGARALGM